MLAGSVKSARETHRQTTLICELQRLSDKFVGTFRLPLDPALLVTGIDIEVMCYYTLKQGNTYLLNLQACSFFNSNTVPLKISFVNADPFGEAINVIYKVQILWIQIMLISKTYLFQIGDDLRQDILVLQMIKLMEKIWLRAGLDLKIVTYQCVATGTEEGLYITSIKY